jgi:hypothetical protein
MKKKTGILGRRKDRRQVRRRRSDELHVRLDAIEREIALLRSGQHGIRMMVERVDRLLDGAMATLRKMRALP